VFSQYDEEQYILEATDHIDKGRFLDIGAWHPECFSNTRALYLKGWSGVMVEPSPVPFANLLKEYGNNDRIKLVLAAVHDETLVSLHVSEDSVSTTDEANFEKWKSAAAFNGTIWVGTIPLELLKDEGPYDFVNIDAEGLSGALFQEMLGEWEARPACVCVEHDDRLDYLTNIAALRGYQLRYANGTNAVFALPTR
jgi:FkbM family methyltransferase